MGRKVPRQEPFSGLSVYHINIGVYIYTYIQIFVSISIYIYVFMHSDPLVGFMLRGIESKVMKARNQHALWELIPEPSLQRAPEVTLTRDRTPDMMYGIILNERGCSTSLIYIYIYIQNVTPWRAGFVEFTKEYFLAFSWKAIERHAFVLLL